MMNFSIPAVIKHHKQSCSLSQSYSLLVLKAIHLKQGIVGLVPVGVSKEDYSVLCS